MLLFISELFMFISTLGGASYSFDSAKNLTKIDDINIGKVITELNGKNYDILTKNAKADKEKGIIYKEIVLKFNEGDLNPDLCKLLNSNISLK